MALAFVPRYRATLASKIGDAIQRWELCIYRSYEDTGALPSWATDQVRELTFDSSGATLEYVGRYDIYKPIIGSKLQFTLKSIVEGEFENFNEGGQFEYRVDLLSYDAAGRTKKLYWRGYITPVDSTESLSFAPFNVTFEALDGLGSLGDYSFPPPASFDHHITAGGNLLLIDIIKFALARTGANLDLYVYSGIYQRLFGISGAFATPLEALLHDSVVPYAFTGRKLKELLEGILVAYNCRIIQTQASWVIFNASLVSDNIKFTHLKWTGTAYMMEGELGGTNLTKVMHGRSGADFIYLNGSQVTRLPYGSIECTPRDLSETFYLNDYDFGLGLEGWNYTVPPLSTFVGWTYNSRAFRSDWRLPANPQFSTNANEHRTGGRSIWTSNHFFTIENRSSGYTTYWFSGRTPRVVHLKSPIIIDIYYLVKDMDTDNINSVRIINAVQLRHAIVQELPNQYYYNFITGRWIRSTGPFNREVYQDSTRGLPTRPPFVTSEVREADQDVWRRKRIEIPPNEQFEQLVVDGTSQIEVAFFYPTCEDDDGTGNAPQRRGSSYFKLFIDRIEIYNRRDSEVTAPHFERIQEDWNTSYQYSPMVVDGSATGIAQKLIKDSRVSSDTPVYFYGSRSGQTLEEVSTQLKLNDFADRLQTFELSIASTRSGVPFHAIDRLKVDFNDYKSGYSATGDQTIFASGKFNLATGIYDIVTYSPNQTRDVAPTNRGEVSDDDYAGGNLLPGFYTQNVDLVFSAPVVTDDPDLPLTLDCVPPEDLTKTSATIVVQVRHGKRPYTRFDFTWAGSQRTLSPSRIDANGQYRFKAGNLQPDTLYSYRARIIDSAGADKRITCTFRTTLTSKITTLYAFSIDVRGVARALNFASEPRVVFMGDISDVVIDQSNIVTTDIQLPDPNIFGGTVAGKEYSRSLYPVVRQPTLRRVRVKNEDSEPAVFEFTQPPGSDTPPPLPTIVLTVDGRDQDAVDVPYNAHSLTVGYVRNHAIGGMTFTFNQVVISSVTPADANQPTGTLAVAIKENTGDNSRTEALNAFVTNDDGRQRGFDTLLIRQAGAPGECDGKPPQLVFDSTSQTVDGLGDNITAEYPFTLKCADPNDMQYQWNFGSNSEFASARTGTGKVIVTVAANTSSNPRSATLQAVIDNDVSRASGSTVRANLSLIQRGAPGPEVTISPSKPSCVNIPVGGGMATYTYTIANGTQDDLVLVNASTYSGRAGYKFGLKDGSTTEGEIVLPIKSTCSFVDGTFDVVLNIANSVGFQRATGCFTQAGRDAYGSAPTVAWDPRPQGGIVTLPSNSAGARETINYTLTNADWICDVAYTNPASWLSVVKGRSVDGGGNVTYRLDFRATQSNLSIEARSANIVLLVKTSGYDPVRINIGVVQPAGGDHPTINVASGVKSTFFRGGNVTFDFDIEEADGSDFSLADVKSDVEVQNTASWVSFVSWTENSFNTGNPFRLTLSVSENTGTALRNDNIDVVIVRGGQDLASVNIKVVQNGRANPPVVTIVPSAVSLTATQAHGLVGFGLASAVDGDISITTKSVNSDCEIDTSTSESPIWDGTFTIRDVVVLGVPAKQLRFGVNTNTGPRRDATLTIIADNAGGRDCDDVTITQAAGTAPTPTLTWVREDLVTDDFLQKLPAGGITVAINYRVTNAVYSDVSVARSSVPSWVTYEGPNRLGSNTGGNFSFIVAANTSTSVRTATLRLELSGGNNVDISISQLREFTPPPPEPEITVTPGDSVDADGSEDWTGTYSLASSENDDIDGFFVKAETSDGTETYVAIDRIGTFNQSHPNSDVPAPSLPTWFDGDPSHAPVSGSVIRGTITVNVKENTATSVREFTLYLGVSTDAGTDYGGFTVVQDAADPPPPVVVHPDCTISLSITSRSFTSDGGMFTSVANLTNVVFSPVTTSGITVTSNESWAVATKETGTFSNQVDIKVVVAANTTSEPRTARITVSGKNLADKVCSGTISIDQAAPAGRPSLVVTPVFRELNDWEPSSLGVLVSFNYNLANGLRSQITLPTKPDCISLHAVSGTDTAGTIQVRVKCINSTFSGVKHALSAEVRNDGGTNASAFEVRQSGRQGYTQQPGLTLSANRIDTSNFIADGFQVTFTATNAIPYYDLSLSRTQLGNPSASNHGIDVSIHSTRNLNTGSIQFVINNIDAVLSVDDVDVTLTTNAGSVTRRITVVKSDRGTRP